MYYLITLTVAAIRTRRPAQSITSRVTPGLVTLSLLSHDHDSDIIPLVSYFLSVNLCVNRTKDKENNLARGIIQMNFISVRNLMKLFICHSVMSGRDHLRVTRAVPIGLREYSLEPIYSPWGVLPRAIKLALGRTPLGQKFGCRD